MIPRKPCPRWALPLSLILLSLLAAPLYGQQSHDPPGITVSFDLTEAPLYHDLPDRTQVEQEMAAYMAKRCDDVKAFNFVRWQATSDTSIPPEEIKASLTLKLAEVDTLFGAYQATQVLMNVSIQIENGTARELDLEKTLYGYTELDKHKQNTDKLKARIRSKIDEWFDAGGAENFQTVLMDELLKKVPISETVQIDEDNYLIIIPMRAQEQDTADNASLLRAQFSAIKDSTSYDGRFTVEVKGPYTLPGTMDKVLYCMIKTFFYPKTFYYQFPPLDLRDLTPEPLHATFGRDIKEILSDARRESITVYMDSYRTYTDVLAGEQ